MLGRRWLAIWVHSNSLIKDLTPFENDAEICLFNFLMYANSQKILLSRWLHSKLISTLKFLSNWKTMLWDISQEQHSIKILEFIETNSYFYSFTYEKNIFSSSSHQCVVFLRICWQTEKLWIQHQNFLCLLEIQTMLLFLSLHKIQMSKQHILIN